MAPLSLSPAPLDDAMLPVSLKNNHADIADRIAIMRIQEETTYRIKDYRTHPRSKSSSTTTSTSTTSKPVDAECRIKMCEWCFQVVDFCKFRRETVTIGMSFLDRYVTTPTGRSALQNRKEYQLAAMTALYIAIKLHEPLEMETSLLADLSRGCYTEMEFVGMEQQMLQAIHWRVNGPTCFGFLAHFMALLPRAVPTTVAQALLEYARYQTELAVAEQALLIWKPSELALAAVLNALEGLDVRLLSTRTRTKFLKYLERYSEMSVAKMEPVQSQLSYLVAQVASREFSSLDPERVVQQWQDHQPDLTTSDKHSSKSSKSSKKESSSFSKQRSPVSVMDEPNSTASTTTTTTTKSSRSSHHSRSSSTRSSRSLAVN